MPALQRPCTCSLDWLDGHCGARAPGRGDTSARTEASIDPRPCCGFSSISARWCRWSKLVPSVWGWIGCCPSPNAWFSTVPIRGEQEQGREGGEKGDHLPSLVWARPAVDDALAAGESAGTPVRHADNLASVATGRLRAARCGVQPAIQVPDRTRLVGPGAWMVEGCGLLCSLLRRPRRVSVAGDGRGAGRAEDREPAGGGDRDRGRCGRRGRPARLLPRRTEGWPAGLRLAGLTLRQHSSPAADHPVRR
jgi:hypothetical protein